MAGARLDLDIRPVTADDRNWVDDFLREHWGSDRMVAHGTLYYPAELPGFIAMRGDHPAGLVTYNIEGTSCEIVTIDAVQKGGGVGSVLVEAMKHEAIAHGCTRLWLITTNDNLRALRFYQRRGFVLAVLRPNALEDSRTLKPEIPLIGEHGIPLRDELELEMRL